MGLIFRTKPEGLPGETGVALTRFKQVHRRNVPAATVDHGIDPFEGLSRRAPEHVREPVAPAPKPRGYIRGMTPKRNSDLDLFDTGSITTHVLHRALPLRAAKLQNETMSAV